MHVMVHFFLPCGISLVRQLNIASNDEDVSGWDTQPAGFVNLVQITQCHN
jgi:hypothetical protein